MAWRRIGDKPLSEPMLTLFTYAYMRHKVGGGGGGGDKLNTIFMFCSTATGPIIAKASESLKNISEFTSWITFELTFWKSNFEQHLACRFDIMDNILIFLCVLTYAIINVLIHHIIFRFYPLKYYFLSTLVLTSSIDVVFILSMGILYFHFP